MMTAFLIRAAAFVVTIAVLVIAHEFGHYLVARWCNVKVLRFSFGMGRVLWSRKLGRDQTEWALSLFPIGGYVKMLDETEGDVPVKDLPRAFNRQPVGKRIAIVAAGPLTNFLLAILFFAMLGMIGTNERLPVLSTPAPHSAAEKAGIESQDRVTHINETAIDSLIDFQWQLLTHARQEVLLTVDRGGAARVLPLSLAEITTRDEEEGRVFSRLGIAFYTGAPVVRATRAGMPAERAGILPGDKIIVVDQRPVENAQALSDAMNQSPESPVEITVQRGEETRHFTLTPTLFTDEKTGNVSPKIGVELSLDPDQVSRLQKRVRHDPVTSLRLGVTRTWEMTWMSLKMMGKMVIGEAALKNISGPITIADFAGQSAMMGLDRFVSFLAMVSIALGIINLMPIPLLDGGHLLYYSLELLRGRPLSEKAMAIGQKIGMTFLLALIALALLNDFTRLL
ncbi:MAG: RIP metalloprotease RseP [Burkholderiales bacterium]|jgi:regulator of sigma E protease|nr:RIP metalloprotease RseP [Burkholderiales bacterium]